MPHHSLSDSIALCTYRGTTVLVRSGGRAIAPQTLLQTFAVDMVVRDLQHSTQDNKAEMFLTKVLGTICGV